MIERRLMIWTFFLGISFGLELTEEGIKLNAKHENAERQIWHRILSLLDSDHDREMLIHLMTTMVNKLD